MDPVTIETWAEAMSPNIMGIRKGLTRFGPRSMSISCCWGEGADTADAAADDHSDAVRVDGAGFQAGLPASFLGGDGSELGEPVHPPGVFAVKVALRVEALNLGGELGVEAL